MKQKVGKKEKKKNKVLDFVKLEYHIAFLITQIIGQQCHSGVSPRNLSLRNLSTRNLRVLFRTRFCETQVLKKW